MGARNRALSYGLGDVFLSLSTFGRTLDEGAEILDERWMKGRNFWTDT